ncbi:hypothetical protein HK104_009551 [Borealophlyctis nickersoniae]|nr:hypothetical protein HK104_009551 [Borealophlyctis nickersoniae]
MSYLTAKCGKCNGTGRIHKDESVACTASPSSTCPGCSKCRDCIDGKVVCGAPPRPTAPSPVGRTFSDAGKTVPPPLLSSSSKTGSSGSLLGSPNAPVTPSPRTSPPKRPAIPQTAAPLLGSQTLLGSETVLSSESEPPLSKSLPLLDKDAGSLVGPPLSGGQTSAAHDGGVRDVAETVLASKEEGEEEQMRYSTPLKAKSETELSARPSQAERRTSMVGDGPGMRRHASGSDVRTSVVQGVHIVSAEEGPDPEELEEQLSIAMKGENVPGVITVEGPGGTLMAVPALPVSDGTYTPTRGSTTRKSVTGAKISAIVSNLQTVGDTKLNTKHSHLQSMELLNDRAVAKKHKTVFEGDDDIESEAETSPTRPQRQGSPRRSPMPRMPEIPEPAPISPIKSPPPTSPGLPQRPKSEVFGFGAFRTKNRTGSPKGSVEESDNSPSVASPIDTRVTSSQPTLNISGGVGIRKGRKGAQSNLSLNSSTSATASAPSLESESEKSPSGAAGRRTSKNFREWYNSFVSAANKQLEGPVVRFRIDEIALFNGGLASERREADRYRVLDIFKDGKIEALQYNTTNAAGVEIITAGTPDKLLDALIFPLGQDMSYAEVFLATYRFFLPAKTVLNWLIEWYNVDVDDDCLPSQETFLRKNRKHIQSRAIKVLLLWVKNHWHDFHTAPDLVAELSSFVEHVAQVSFGDGQKMTQAIREQRLSWYTTQYIPPFVTKRGVLNDNTRPWALQWEPADFAHQLTLIDHMLFKQIRPDAYLHIMHQPAPRVGGGHNVALKVILEYIAWFRLVATYTETIILGEEVPKKRGKAIKQFIKIAKVCRELNNFNTTLAIVYGLARPSIARLTQAWESISGKYVDSFRALLAIMDPTADYASLWSAFKTVEPPGIPFLAAYMQDLLEIHEEVPIEAESLPAESSTLRRRRGRRRQATGDSHLSGSESEDLDSSGALTDELGETEENGSGTTEPTGGRTINFQKFYSLYSIVSEIEAFRTLSYREAIQVEKDSTAMVLTHMKDFALGEVGGLSTEGGGPPTPTGPAVGSPASKSVKRMSSLARLMSDH